MSKTLKIISLFTVLFFSANLFAHAKVDTTLPQDGEILTEIPETLYLRFVKKVRLTKITVQLNDEEPIELSLRKHKKFKKRFSLPNPLASKGQHKVEWRGLARDGHTIEGVFTFIVK